MQGWPPASPGALNAWLLLVTTKPPTWRDPLVHLPDDPLTLGAPHPLFLYPDPIGFWAEVRRWITVLLKEREPAWDGSDALAVSALVHLGELSERLDVAMATCRPRLVLFLDEPAWGAAGWDVRVEPHHVPDPHRSGLVYQGFWGRRGDGVVVGKAPQHPSAHRFYRRADMDGFLRSAR